MAPKPFTVICNPGLTGLILLTEHIEKFLECHISMKIDLLYMYMTESSNQITAGGAQ
jgi:hypothetical protein